MLASDWRDHSAICMNNPHGAEILWKPWSLCLAKNFLKSHILLWDLFFSIPSWSHLRRNCRARQPFWSLGFFASPCLILGKSILSCLNLGLLNRLDLIIRTRKGAETCQGLPLGCTYRSKEAVVPSLVQALLIVILPLHFQSSVLFPQWLLVSLSLLFLSDKLSLCCHFRSPQLAYQSLWKDLM